MTVQDQRQLLMTVFLRLRQEGFAIGVGELLAALTASEGGWGKNSGEELKRVVMLIWCHSREEVSAFEAIWESLDLSSTGSTSNKQTSEYPGHQPAREAEKRDRQIAAPPGVPDGQGITPQASTALTPLPVQSPQTHPVWDDTSDLQTYWPVSRRFMVYAWRYLRRPVADGPEEVLDIQNTVERAARQGFYLSPVYKRRERNHAHLVILLDQGGSMTPFHGLTRDLAETAQHESNIGYVDIFYFHNVWSSDIYLDSYRTLPIPVETALAECGSDSSVLIVSDGGAARGHRRLDRVRATAELIHQLKRYTALVAWLNPMPMGRWSNSSAQIISHLVPMFQMNPDGFSSAIDALRGQPLHHYK